MGSNSGHHQFSRSERPNTIDPDPGRPAVRLAELKLQFETPKQQTVCAARQFCCAQRPQSTAILRRMFEAGFREGAEPAANGYPLQLDSVSPCRSGLRDEDLKGRRLHLFPVVDRRPFHTSPRIDPLGSLPHPDV
ncbi:hypothetical protein [Micromonospora sp. NPDC005161]